MVLTSRLAPRRGKIKSETWLRLLAAAVVFLLAAINIMKVYYPRVVPDETGYWAAAAYFYGLDWSGVMSHSPFYSIGYGIWLAPLFIIKDPANMYRAAILLNGLFLVGIFFLSCKIADLLLPKQEKYITTLMAAGVTLYGYNLFYTQSTQVEVILTFFSLLIVVQFICFVRNPTYLKSVGIAVVGSYIYALHMRMLGLLIALALVMVCLLLRRKINWKHMMAVVITGAIMLILFAVLSDLITAAQYSGGAVDNNSYSGQVGKLAYLFSLEGIINLICGVIGRLFYYGAASFFLFYLGFGVLVYQVIVFIKTKGKGAINEDFEIYLFLLLVLLAGIGISTLSMLEPARIDTVMYGRYAENSIVPILILGYSVLPKLKKPLQTLLGLSGLQLLFAGVIFAYYKVYNVVEIGGQNVVGISYLPNFFRVSNHVFYTFYAACFSILVCGVIFAIVYHFKSFITVLLLLPYFWASLTLPYMEKFYFNKSVSLRHVANFIELELEDRTMLYYIEGADTYENAKEEIELTEEDLTGSIEEELDEPLAEELYEEDEEQAEGELVVEEEVVAQVNYEATWAQYQMLFLLAFSDMTVIDKDDLPVGETEAVLIIHKKSDIHFLDLIEYVRVRAEGDFSIYVHRESELLTQLIEKELYIPPEEKKAVWNLNYSWGENADWRPVSNGEGGYFMYGPYVSLPAGRYEVTVELALEKAVSTFADGLIGAVDTGYAVGEILLAEQDLTYGMADEEGKIVAFLHFELPDPINDWELRVLVHEGVALEVENIKMAYQAFDAEHAVEIILAVP